ncbi:MAG TPA: YaiI/YqxD family protein [Gammaproteobacteria bacterium]|nr:YaiI/YqxD family protein [Gammaproteobacteria bacterium]
MQIWVDADACPRVIRDILLRAAARRSVVVTLVANAPMPIRRTPNVKLVRVPSGFDEADRYIEQSVAAGDLVITADVPLAADVIGRGASALTPRGQMLTGDNIGERLTMRDAMQDLRDAGVELGGPSSFSARDRQDFANALDRFLTANR